MDVVFPSPEGQAETIGQRLRRLRHERGLSQRELASPGVSYAYISRIEAGARRPSVKALRMLARKLGVSADYLETGSEIRDVEERELRIADAELGLRLDEDTGLAEAALRQLHDEAAAAGDAIAASRVSLALGLAYDASARLGSVAATYALEHLGGQSHAYTWDEFAERYEGHFGAGLRATGSSRAKA